MPHDTSSMSGSVPNRVPGPCTHPFKGQGMGMALEWGGKERLQFVSFLWLVPWGLEKAKCYTCGESDSRYTGTGPVSPSSMDLSIIFCNEELRQSGCKEPFLAQSSAVGGVSPSRMSVNTEILHLDYLLIGCPLKAYSHNANIVLCVTHPKLFQSV